MKAMVLAAGEGRRLRPLTDALPKALIEVGGLPMLEGVLRRLERAGVTDAIINAFHLPDHIERFVRQRAGSLRLEVSREEVLLDTGGGLKKAAWFLEGGEPFFLYNADVVSGVDLGAMYKQHQDTGALATLAVRARASSRQLLFDAEGQLRGRRSPEGDQWTNGPAAVSPLGFDGIHVISPALLPKLTETGIFPITTAYLRLAGTGERIRAFRSDAYSWADIGSAEKLEAVRADVQKQGLPA